MAIVRPEGLSMKNSNDTIRNRNHNLPACSTVPQPTAPPCAPHHAHNTWNCENLKHVISNVSSSWTAWPWNCRHYDPLKYHEVLAQWQCYIFNRTTVRTSNHASLWDSSFDTLWAYRPMPRFHRNVRPPSSSCVVLFMLPTTVVALPRVPA
jgi:hypothetical protein